MKSISWPLQRVLEVWLFQMGVFQLSVFISRSAAQLQSHLDATESTYKTYGFGSCNSQRLDICLFVVVVLFSFLFGFLFFSPHKILCYILGK